MSSWAGPEDIYVSTSLASYLDRKLLVLLRDGRKLMGTLRSFDQFGLYVIRGENVVLIGELDTAREELPRHMIRVSEAEIKRAQKAEKEASELRGTMRKRMDTAREELPRHMIRVSEAEIKRAQKAEKEASELRGTMRKRMEFLDFD